MKVPSWPVPRPGVPPVRGSSIMASGGGGATAAAACGGGWTVSAVTLGGAGSVTLSTVFCIVDTGAVMWAAP